MKNHHLTHHHPVGTELNLCRSYLLSQVELAGVNPLHSPGPGPAVTICCQAGAGEQEVGRRIAELLQVSEPVAAPPWTLFDRQLVEQVLREQHFPESMAKFIPEDRRPLVEEEIGELLGLYPPAWEIVPQISKTILHLANAGYVVLVGRGAAFITAHLPNVFHVRLVAPFKDRMKRVKATENISEKAAAKFVAEKDRGQSRYARAYFHGNAGDDLLYHLIINTGRIPCPEAAELVSEQARKFFQNEGMRHAAEEMNKIKAAA
jgi:Cytidylate kinase-like family